MQRRGIPFAELTDRVQYFAENYALSIKQDPRTWKVKVGKSELAKVLEFGSVVEEDLLRKNDLEMPMYGTVSNFISKPYIYRCNNWYPLTSKYNDDGITEHGVTFLRFHFVLFKRQSYYEVLPVRNALEVWPKLRYPSQEYDDPFKRLMQMKQLAFFLPLWEKQYNALKRIHDDFKKERWHLINMNNVSKDQMNDFYYWFGYTPELEKMIEAFPTREDLLKFFFSRITENSSFNARARIIASPYRDYMPVCWEIIRSQKYLKDIPGPYGGNFYTKWLEADQRRRAKNGQIVRVKPWSDQVVERPRKSAFLAALAKQKEKNKN
jgi:hypothetical protein